jgi:hypothetical protein
MLCTCVDSHAVQCKLFSFFLVGGGSGYGEWGSISKGRVHINAKVLLQLRLIFVLSVYVYYFILSFVSFYFTGQC